VNTGINRRSININGKVTSIALESVFWIELDRRARNAGISWADYSRKLLEELGAVQNRASALKQHLMHTTPGSVRATKIEVTGPEGSTCLQCRGNRIIIGRNASSEVILNDSKASRAHAVLVEINNSWWVGDLQSRNGTWFGKKRIVFEPMPPKKVIRIGQHLLQIVQ
jgi:predicted DNA-binding ribbon-helix-helix protein